MNEQIRQRIQHVLGMSNYSLCLRNCEHVANDIMRSRWISSQMDVLGPMMKIFKKYIMEDDMRKVNAFPSSIQPYVFKKNNSSKQLYSFIISNIVATRFDYYLDCNEDRFKPIFGHFCYLHQTHDYH